MNLRLQRRWFEILGPKKPGRPYQAGDDPRAIDWTVHARLRELVVRVSRVDAHLRVHLLLDTSGSMSAGTPDKLSCARRVTAALGYIALRRRDAVGIATFDDTVRRYVAPASGKPQLFRIFEALESTQRGVFELNGVVEAKQ